MADEQPARSRLSRLGSKRPRETRLQLAERISDAYGLVLFLILTTFVVTMTLPQEGKVGRVVAIAFGALTAITALTSSDVRAARVRLAVIIACTSVAMAALAELIPSEPLLGAAFALITILLAIAAPTILRRVLTAVAVDFRTILGAISVYTLLGLLFSFAYLALGRWQSASVFTGVAHPKSSDYLFFSYTTLTTTGYGNLVPAGVIGQIIAVFEMLIGQIFLITLVAGLVSLWRPGAKIKPDESGS